MENKQEMTVKELREALKKFDPNSIWHGWDDGSIVIDFNGKPQGFIDPGYYNAKGKEVKVYGKVRDY